MAELTIFLSHNSKYVDIARSVMRSLHALDKHSSLDIKLSEDMQGSEEWRKWIEQNIGNANLFLLLYPSADIDMSWCNYELGRFDDGKRKVTCIKNTDIDKFPSTFGRYHGYTADAPNIRRFIEDVFANGTFTPGFIINADVKKTTHELYELTNTIANDLAKEFTKARVRLQRYERRVVLLTKYDPSKRFLAEASKIEGNPEGLNLLRLAQGASVQWLKVRDSIPEDWPRELEAALPRLTEGTLPSGLSPFYAAGCIYIPVISRAQSVDGQLEEVALIFVAVDSDKLRRFVDWSLPKRMPDDLAMLVRLIRMMFRSRWEILEPRYQEATDRRPPLPERCAEIVSEVNAASDQMRQDCVNQGITGIDQFYSYFADELKTDVRACGNEWNDLLRKLSAEPVKDSKDLTARLGALLTCNAKWLELGAKQFAIGATKLKQAV
jgi:hypothetical protein